MPPCLTLTPAARQASPTHAGQLRADRVGEADVGHQAFAEEGGDAAAGAVEELVGDDEIERAVLFLERADGAEGDDALHAQRLHAVDVGAEVQLRGRDAVAAAVAREEGDLASGERAEDVVVRRAAEGRLDVGFFLGFEAGHGVESAAADDSDFRFQCLLS